MSARPGTAAAASASTENMNTTYNYVVSASKETAINHSLTGSFLADDSIDVICDKGTRIEVRTLKDEKLELVATVPVFGRVVALKLLRPVQDQPKDWVFVLTNRMQFFVLSYENGKVVDKGHGDLVWMSKSVPAPLVAVDSKSRFVVVHLYPGLLSLIPFDPRTGQVRETTMVSLEEYTLLDMVFSSASGRSLLCILHEDNRSNRHVKTYEITPRNMRELSPGPWSQPNVDPTAHRLVSVFDGVLLFSTNLIVHLREGASDPSTGISLQRSISVGTAGATTIPTSGGASAPTQVPIQQAVLSIFMGKIAAVGHVEKDGSRLLFGDEYGGLHVLALTHSQQSLQMTTDILGATSIATGICYLDSGIVFVGSHFGDSQLVRLLTERDEATQSCVELLESYSNLGPITSMCVVDLDKQGRGQLVTCSGGMKDGSLRVVRNGVGVDEQCSIDLTGIKGMWSIKPSKEARHDKFLVQSYTTETRVFGIVSGDDENAMETEDDAGGEGEQSLSELTPNPAFVCDKSTLFCGNVEADWICQVTPTMVRYIKCSSLLPGAGNPETNDWVAPDGARITVASASAEAANSFSLALGLTGGKVVILDGLGTNERIIQMEHEVSCISLSQEFMAVGLWTDLSVRIIMVASGKEVHKEQSPGEEALPRSVVLTRFGGQTSKLHLLVGLGDGRLLFFRVDDTTGIILPNWRRTVALGNSPVELTLFDDATMTSKHVFAACDRPAIVYATQGDKLLLSNVNVSMEVTRACAFDSEPFPACLALASEERLVIGTVNDVQKIHVRTVPLGEQPKRIAHQPQTNAFGVCTLKIEDNVYPAADGGAMNDLPLDASDADFPEACYVRLLDDRSFDILDSHRLDEMEHAVCIASMPFAQEGDTEMQQGDVQDSNAKQYFVVGTAYAHEDESEPSKGRILVFEVIRLEGDDRRLVLVTEKATKGAVYDICPFGGKLLAGINAKVQLYRWNDRSSGLIGISPVPASSTTTTTTNQTPRAGAGLAANAPSSANGLGGGADLLSQECGYHGHVLSLFVRSYGNYIIVGDLVKSVSLLYWDPETNSIVEKARDFSSTWVASLAVLDGTSFLSSDIAGNMIMVRPDIKSDEDARMLIAGEFHWGDFINCFCKGSLIMRQKQEGEDEPTQSDNGTQSQSSVETTLQAMSQIQVRAVPRLLFGTAGGAIGVLATLTQKEFNLLNRLQTAMNEVVEGIGGQKHLDWRAFSNQNKTRPSRGFIDGDLIEMLLEMSHQDVEKVVELMNRGLSDNALTTTIITSEPPKVDVASLISLVEELTRLH